MQTPPGNPSGFRGRLTESGGGGIHVGVKLLSVLGAACLILGLRGTASGQAAAPPEVAASAVSAVAELGKQVEIGRYEFAIRRMYPTWKERMAARVGGEQELEKQLADAAEQMVSKGVAITSFLPQGRPTTYEVGIGKKVDMVNGQPAESLIYTKWLVLVPTLTKFTVRPQGGGKPVTIESSGFQAAISDKGRNDWTFIDGSKLNANELRKLFVNLPHDIELPPVEMKESR